MKEKERGKRLPKTQPSFCRILPTLRSPNRNGARKRQGVRSGCRLQWLQWFAVEIQSFSSIGLFCWAMTGMSQQNVPCKCTAPHQDSGRLLPRCVCFEAGARHHSRQQTAGRERRGAGRRMS
jgi:hypothetical protein